MMRMLSLAILCLLIAVASASAKTWYVRADLPTAGDGGAAERAFTKIQQAADVVQAGDTVVIGPGVYFEHVQLKTKGSAEKPILFKADSIAKNRVIVTGADPDVRQRKVKWTLEDQTLGLYSIPWTNARPTRVLYSGTDLYPYIDLDKLRAFTPVIAAAGKSSAGPQHGYTMDGKKLYVRLHPSGRYGATDPNQHTMSISGPLGEGDVGLKITQPSQYNFGILGQGDAHVVIQGITFETPGVTGLYTEANDITVRDCWFIGCRSGVGGTAPYLRPKDYTSAAVANRVTVEHCYFTQYPTYNDSRETIELAKAAGDANAPFWHRKDLGGGLPDAKMNYEVGLASLAGRDWVIRRNHCWNAFEALSSRCVTNSENLQVYENLVEEMSDNAFETEDHSTNMRIYRNVIRDTFVPISWQPLESKPWPGPVFVYQNIIYSTKEHADLFAFRSPYVFKIGAVKAQAEFGKDYVPELPTPGLLFFNNTIFWDRGCLFWDAIWGNNPDQVGLYNNIIMTEMNLPAYWTKRLPFLKLQNNLCQLPAKQEFASQTVRGSQTLGLRDPAKLDFRPEANSPLLGKAIDIAGAGVQFRDLGAIQEGDDWYPLKNAGPREDKP